MNNTIVGGIAAGFLAMGILVGAAGTFVVRDATTGDLVGNMAADMGGHMTADMGSMMSMMSMMSGSMMGQNGSIGPGMMAPGSSTPPMDPSDHDSHHALPSPQATE